MTHVESIKVETRPVKWIVDGFHKGQIFIDNSFQRRYVWTTKDKVSLIETILLGFPIPEVYLWENETDPESGETPYSVVDGQQRLGAVRDFVNNEFMLSRTGLEGKDKDYAGKHFKDLEPGEKSKIWSYPFSIRFISQRLNKDAIVNLFLRLNRTNATLNPQELRNAEFSGQFMELAGRVSELEFWSKNKIFSPANYRRMIDIQFISTLLIFIRLGIEEETTQSAINRVYDQYNEDYPEANEDFHEIVEVLNLLDSLISNKKWLQDAAKRKTHFYTLFVLAYYLKESNSRIPTPILSAKLDSWFKKYFNEELFENDKENSSRLAEYQQLSQEGVQKKSNRLRRFRLLQEFIEG